MPSISYTAAFLMLNKAVDPWAHQQFRDVTGCQSSPLKKDGPSPPSANWDDETKAAVVAFVDAFAGKDEKAAAAFVRKRRPTDNFQVGRHAFTTWFNRAWHKKWKCNSLLDNHLESISFSVYNLAASTEDRSVRRFAWLTTLLTIRVSSQRLTARASSDTRYPPSVSSSTRSL